MWKKKRIITCKEEKIIPIGADKLSSSWLCKVGYLFCPRIDRSQDVHFPADVINHWKTIEGQASLKVCPKGLRNTTGNAIPLEWLLCLHFKLAPLMSTFTVVRVMCKLDHEQQRGREKWSFEMIISTWQAKELYKQMRGD